MIQKEKLQDLVGATKNESKYVNKSFTMEATLFDRLKKARAQEMIDNTDNISLSKFLSNLIEEALDAHDKLDSIKISKKKETKSFDFDKPLDIDNQIELLESIYQKNKDFIQDIDTIIDPKDTYYKFKLLEATITTLEEVKNKR